MGWAAAFINPDENFILKDLILTYTTLGITLQLIIAYLTKVFTTENEGKVENLLKGNLLYQALVLTVTNTVAMVLVITFGIDSMLPILSVMVIIRISMEIYFGRKMKII